MSSFARILSAFATLFTMRPFGAPAKLPMRAEQTRCRVLKTEEKVMLFEAFVSTRQRALVKFELDKVPQRPPFNPAAEITEAEAQRIREDLEFWARALA